MGRPSECSCHCATTTTTTTTTTQPPATSACCVGESCFELSSVDCASSSGTWYSGQTCGEIDCGTTPPPDPTGACCLILQGERACVDGITESLCETLDTGTGHSWVEGESCSYAECQAFFVANAGTNNCGFEKWQEQGDPCDIVSVGGGVNDECICDSSLAPPDNCVGPVEEDEEEHAVNYWIKCTHGDPPPTTGTTTTVAPTTGTTGTTTTTTGTSTTTTTTTISPSAGTIYWEFVSLGVDIQQARWKVTSGACGSGWIPSPPGGCGSHGDTDSTDCVSSAPKYYGWDMYRWFPQMGNPIWVRFDTDAPAGSAAGELPGDGTCYGETIVVPRVEYVE